jgi:hypothetical protein
MNVVHNLTGIPQETVQGQRLKVALGMGVPELTAIANSGRAVNGVDSMTAVMALNIIGPAKKAAMEKQTGQQQKAPSVKDQVVAQAAPEDTGIGALPAGEVMSEKGMAAGGIVAFEEGGLTQDITAQIAKLRMRRRALDLQPPAGPVISARGGDTLQRQKDLLDEQIAQLENRFKATQGQEQAYQLQRATETAPGIPFQAPGAPAAGADQAQQPPQGQQPPAGAGAGFGGAPAGFPAVGPSLNAVKSALTESGNFDPMQTIRTFDPTPYNDMLPMTPKQLRGERAAGATTLEGMFPTTREAAESEIGKRYAGLEDMFKQREARAGEARKEAETEKGRTAGLGLMQLASELITKPLTKIDTGAAFQTFKDANTDFRKAQKEYREGLDKIAEARELQKIGQYEKADALFREGAMARFNFENDTTKLALAQDTARKTGILNLADKATQAQDRKLSANLKGAEVQLSTAVKGAELGSEERRTAITANAYGQRYTTPGYLQNLAQDNAAKRLEGLIKADPLLQTRLMKDSSLALQLQNQLYNEELAKLGGTAAPSGGGATGLDMSQWGDPRVKK